VREAKRALICKVIGHLYHEVPNYSSSKVRRCERCGKVSKW